MPVLPMTLTRPTRPETGKAREPVDRSQDVRDAMAQSRKPSNARKNAPSRKPAATRKIAGRDLRQRADSSTARATGGADASTAPRSTTPTPATVDADGGAEPTREQARSRALAFPVIALVVGLVAGIAGIILAFNPGIEPDNRAFVDRDTTEEVLRLGSTHVQRLVAIDYTELDAYQDSLDEFLMPNLVGELNETWDALSTTYEQTETVVEAQTQTVGLSFLTEDRAEVLLVLSVSMTREGIIAGSTTGTYLVEMTRTDDTWKLSRIPDLPS